MTYQEFLDSDLTLEQYVAVNVAEKLAQLDAEIAAERTHEQEQAAAWHDAIAHVVVACGVRPIFTEQIVKQAKGVFDLQNGKLVPKAGIVHTTDPCRDYTPVDWLAELHSKDDNLLWPKTGETQ